MRNQFNDMEITGIILIYWFYQLTFVNGPVLLRQKEKHSMH